MAIKQVKTITLLEEIETDGHSPMKFLCDDIGIYFCKYRSGHSLNSGEIDFLVYEIVCHYLLKSLDIPTPEIALVTLQKDSFNTKDLNVNRKYAKPGVVCFGSKEVVGSNLITGLELIKGKVEFRQYYNPEDLIRIAAFDIWIENTDRGREENFNLLAHTYLGKSRIIAFDHAFGFHGQNGQGGFNPAWAVNTGSNLARTAYFKSIVRHIPKKEVISIAQKVLDWNPEAVKFAVNEAFTQIPNSWSLSPKLEDRVLSFLLDKTRLQTIKRELLLLLAKPKK